LVKRIGIYPIIAIGGGIKTLSIYLPETSCRQNCSTFWFTGVYVSSKISGLPFARLVQGD